MFGEAHIRIPQRLGLQVREAEKGSLEWLLDIPAWIVSGLASAPTVALVNFVTLMSWREAIRAQLRRLLLTAEERRILQEAARPAPASAPPEEVPGLAYPQEIGRHGGPLQPFQEPKSSNVPLQGALPIPIAERIAANETLVDVEVGEVRVRGMRPETQVVVQQDDDITVVTVRKPTES
jgi:hypothetical protein